MGIIAQENLAEYRREMAKGRTVNYTRQNIDAALQAVVDVFFRPTTSTLLNDEIELAASNVFSAQEKKLIIALAANEVFGQEKV